MISLVWARDEAGTIGRDGGLPWHLPADLAHFKRLTLGKPIIMGRRTWESLPKALPRRVNLVLTRTPGYEALGARVVTSVEEALAAAGAVPEVMIVGGAAIYAAFLPLAARIYETVVATRIAGDVRLPAFDRGRWRETERSERPADEDHAWPLAFVTLERVPEADRGPGGDRPPGDSPAGARASRP